MNGNYTGLPLPPENNDFEDVKRGYLTGIDPPIVKKGETPILDLTKYKFIGEGAPPDTVHPSLWRQSKLNLEHGLFNVCDGVYQVRGYDLANMTIVEVAGGIVIIDCMTATESAEAALNLYRNFGDKDKKCPVKAVILTHSHTDHYGGIGGVLDNSFSKSVDIIAPEHFLEESVLENAFAGDAMTRRSCYQFGTFLTPSEKGHVDCGLGKALQKGGTVSFAAPTKHVVSQLAKEDEILENTNYKIGGITFEFMLAQNTEAPAEMTIYIKDRKCLVNAEISNHTMHNILTPRGAQIRDTRRWWKALDTLLQRYGSEIQVICATHHWPTWGNSECKTFLAEQRDSYKFLHDQTVRLMNKGHTMLEIVEEFEKPRFLPEFMTNLWHTRGYYGTISHNVRAIYQKYLGWFDMNPSNLNPLPQAAAAKKYVELIGADKIRSIMSNADTTTELRWAAELGNHLVFADPSEENRNALAKVYEHLGYACEAATWRNMYLTGAAELKKGGPLLIMNASSANPALLEVMDNDMLFDFMASKFIAQNSEQFQIDILQTDRHINDVGNELAYRFISANGVLNYHITPYASSTPPSQSKGLSPNYYRLELGRATLVELILKTDGLTVGKAVKANKANVFLGDDTTNGNQDAVPYVQKLFDSLEEHNPNFNIVQPK